MSHVRPAGNAHFPLNTCKTAVKNVLSLLTIAANRTETLVER
jgi:hypothetical protein